MFRRFLIAGFAVAAAGAAGAQAPAVTVTAPPDCLPNQHNAAITAKVAGTLPDGASVRLYFRRLNPVGAFYYADMTPEGGGNYWTVFPKPETRDQIQLTDEWWQVLQNRDWLEGNGREWLDERLREKKFEATEYYVAVYDASCQKELARSKMRWVDVLPRDECRGVPLPEEVGWTREFGLSTSLTVGETTDIQAGASVFHWLCDGIVTRAFFDPRDSYCKLRPDDYCRGCVVGHILPFVAGAGVVSAAIIEHPSPSQPPPQP